MARDLVLAIDIGTGSVRAAAVDAAGRILHIARSEQEQVVPAFGWSEQRAEDWWDGAVASVRATLAALGADAARIGSVVACGQMHGTVLIDAAGRPTRPAVPLWNDKRTAGLVADFERANAPDTYLAQTANPATPAWPGFKLQWLRAHDPAAYAAAAFVVMPKDFINLRLTGEVGMDWNDASCSFLADPATRAWSPSMLARLGLDAAKLPPIRQPQDVLGHVTAAAAQATGLPEGLPVFVGGADYPTALIGSGACAPGLASDVTGTSTIITAMTETPVLHPEVCNVGFGDALWGAFVLLESGGDAMRWARRAFHENAVGYDAVVAKAAEAPAGSEALFFLPFLTGERLGAHRNARAQFFGLAAAHGIAHLHRAVMEGVAFAAARYARIMEADSGTRIGRVIASGGGAKTELWLRIKASVYGVPIVVPREAECGVIGCAAIAGVGSGRFATFREAAASLVSYADEVAPDPRWADTYREMQPVFDAIYRHSQALYDRLDALTAREATAAGPQRLLNPGGTHAA
jgi:xylulokinase